MIKTVALILTLLSSINTLNIRNHYNSLVGTQQSLAFGCIQIYKHCGDRQGHDEIYCNDKSDLDIFEGVSAFYLSEGTTVTFYTEKNYGGSSHDYSSTVTCLATDGDFNDKFYSVKIHKPEPKEGCIRLIRHCPQADNYDEVHCEDVPSLKSIGGLSGIYYGPNTKATFYTEENYNGTSVDLKNNVDCLAEDGSWNDKFNSVRIVRPQEELKKGCIKLIKHCPGDNDGNVTKVYCNDQPNLDDLQGVSGIKFGPSTQVVFYTQKDYSGDKIRFNKDVDCLAADGPWNDKLNSFKIISTDLEEGCIKLIRHCPQSDNYTEIICKDRNNLDSLEGLSGIVLGPNTEADFYFENDYKGNKVHIVEEVDCLTDNNDKFHSVKIIKSPSKDC